MTGLAYYRMESNETLEAFGKRIGVSKQLVSFWERGERSIPKKHHEQLEHTTGVLIDLLSKKEINELDKVEIRGQIINANLSCLNEIELREKMKRIDIEKEKEIVGERGSIEWALRTKQFKNTTKMISYVFRILENNMMKYYKEAQDAAEQKRINENIVIPENIEVDNKRQRSHDISRFLED